jgi:TolB-like protein
LAHHFFRVAAERRLFRYLVAYGAAGWVVLQIVDQLVGNSILPRVSYRAVLSFLACGLPGALIVAWFHGASGRQAMPRLEKLLLAGVSAFALTTTGFVVGTSSPTSGVPRALAPTEDPSRIAVMYFEQRGDGEDAEFLATGLTESLIDGLSAVSPLHVVSRNASQIFRGMAAPADSVARTLRVGTIVTGTVTQANDRVRVVVNLTNAQGRQFGSTQLESSRSEIFALQDELSQAVAEFLRRKIGAELGELRLRQGTKSVRAWELVHKGAQAAAEADELVKSSDLSAAARALTEADTMLAQAEVVDPEWIEPIVRRGWLAYRQARLGGMDRDHSEKWIGIGLGHADRSLARDTANGNARELRATLVYWGYLLNLAGTPEQRFRQRDEAEAGFRAAVALDSTRASALTSLSHLLINRGEIAEAKVKALQAYQTDPFLENADLTIWRIFSSSWTLHDVVEARRYCEEGVRRFPSGFRFKQCQLMLYAFPDSASDIKRAWQLVEEFAQSSPPQVRELNRQKGAVLVAMGLARAKMPDSARAVLQRVQLDATQDPLRDVALYESIARTMLGDAEEAVRKLSLYFAANPGEVDGYRSITQSGQLYWYHQALLNEPRYRALVGIR